MLINIWAHVLFKVQLNIVQFHLSISVYVSLPEFGGFEYQPYFFCSMFPAPPTQKPFVILLALQICSLFGQLYGNLSLIMVTVMYY